MTVPILQYKPQFVTIAPVSKDFYYHVYDIWGNKYGKAPEKISKLYADAVYYKKKGDVKNASRSMGLLAHYFGDINNPLHTDQCELEEKIHSNITTETVGAAILAHKDCQTLVSEYGKHAYNKTVEDITKRNLNRAVNDLGGIIVSVGVDARNSSTKNSIR